MALSTTAAALSEAVVRESDYMKEREKRKSRGGGSRSLGVKAERGGFRVRENRRGKEKKWRRGGEEKRERERKEEIEREEEDVVFLFGTSSPFRLTSLLYRRVDPMYLEAVSRLEENERERERINERKREGQRGRERNVRNHKDGMLSLISKISPALIIPLMGITSDIGLPVGIQRIAASK